MVSRSAVRIIRVFVFFGLLFLTFSIFHSLLSSFGGGSAVQRKEFTLPIKGEPKLFVEKNSASIKNNSPQSSSPPDPAFPVSSSNTTQYITPENWNVRPESITAQDKIYFVGHPSSTSIPKSLPPLPKKDQLATEGLFDAHSKNVIVEALEHESSYATGVADVMNQIVKEHPHLKYARANACIFVLCRNSDLKSILESMTTFELTFNHRYNYPYVFVNNEPFSEEFKRVIQLATSSKVEFGLIPKEHWSLPNDIDTDVMRKRFDEMRQNQVMHGDSLSYRFMCRFNSRFFYHHPLLDKYRYYWRVEPGVGFRCIMRYDPLLFMALYNKKYAHAIMAMEYMNTVENLWKETTSFMTLNKIPMNSHMEVLYDKDKNDYNGIHFWSNFEIGDMSFYRGKQYEAYMDHLDKSKGFFMQRYGDAPVHTIAVAMLLNPSETHYFADIAYRHDAYYTCPVKKDNDQSDYPNICTCRRENNWVDEGWWGMNHVKYLESLNRNWEKAFHS